MDARPPHRPMIDESLEDGVLLLTLRLNETNRLTPQAIVLVREKVSTWREDRRVRAMVLASGVDGIFSDGLDPRQVYGKTDGETRAYVRSAIEAIASIFSFPVPVVCAISGHAMAAGAVLAACADYRLIAERGARIGFPEVSIAMNFPSFGTERLRDLVGERGAQDLLYTGRLLRPGEALALGLVDAVHPPQELLAAALDRAKHLARGRSLSLRGLKSALRAKYRGRTEVLIEQDIESLTQVALSADAQEGMLSLIETRRPRFRPDG